MIMFLLLVDMLFLITFIALKVIGVITMSFLVIFTLLILLASACIVIFYVIYEILE